MTINEVLSRFSDVRQTGENQFEACCACHDDRKSSLAISVGDDGRILLHCHAGCTTEAIVGAIGLKMPDLFPARNGTNGHHSNGHHSNGHAKNGKPKIVAKYNYRDETGETVSQVIRQEPKGFRQRKPDGEGGWDWNVKGVRVVPYRLPELLAEPDRTVVVCEGEKDCDNLARIGILATCNAGGAGKWTSEHAKFLKDRGVIIVADNDDAGRKHAQQVAKSLHGIAKWIKIIYLPGLPEKGDASDWIAAGGTKEQFRKLAENTPDWTPATEPSKPSENECRAVEPGTRVKASDRENLGIVVEDRGSTCLVHFESPRGDVADVDLPKSELTLTDGTPLAGSGYVPAMLSVAQFAETHSAEPTPVINGLLRRGEIGNLVSTSKQGKSLLSLQLALSMAVGREFLGFEMKPSRVLILDAELQPGSLANRIATTAREMNLDLQAVGNRVVVESLRQNPQSISDLKYIYSAIRPGDFGLIVIDPIYRFWPPGFNENDNAAMGAVYSSLAAWASSIEAAVLLIHHPAKGDTSDRSVADAGSGAGAFARACDSQIVIYPHADTGEAGELCCLEAITRTFQRPSPRSVVYSYPLWHLSDAEALRGNRANREALARQKRVEANAVAIADYLAGFPYEWVPRTQIVSGTMLSKDKFETGIQSLIAAGRIERREQPLTKKDGSESSRYLVFFRLSDSENANPTRNTTTNPTTHGGEKLRGVGSLRSRPDTLNYLPGCDGADCEESENKPDNQNPTTHAEPSTNGHCVHDFSRRVPTNDFRMAVYCSKCSKFYGYEREEANA